MARSLRVTETHDLIRIGLEAGLKGATVISMDRMGWAVPEAFKVHRIA